MDSFISPSFLCQADSPRARSRPIPPGQPNSTNNGSRPTQPNANQPGGKNQPNEAGQANPTPPNQPNSNQPNTNQPNSNGRPGSSPGRTTPPGHNSNPSPSRPGTASHSARYLRHEVKSARLFPRRARLFRAGLGCAGAWLRAAARNLARNSVRDERCRRTHLQLAAAWLTQQNEDRPAAHPAASGRMEKALLHNGLRGWLIFAT